MSVPLLKLFARDVNALQISLVRYGHHIRGKPPGIARNLKQRLEEINYKDPALHFKVDIGFPRAKPSRSQELRERIAILRAAKSNPETERLSRMKQLQVPLKEVKEEWLKTAGPLHIRRVAEHYGVYDLFGDAYFTPRVKLDVQYKITDESYLPVHRGNVIKPSEAETVPEVAYVSEPSSLWTLILTNPDGHLTKQNAEYVHWFVGNIPGDDISQGEVVWNYLQPFPPRGTGFHRFVFILYKQERKMDYTQLKKVGPCLQLEERTFQTLDFYRERQDDITPAGLAFFQSDWDKSLTDFFHNTLNMQEPVYEYDFPKPYSPPQKWFPLKQSFNLYMDRYRDSKQVTKEYLMKKLKEVHPFRKPDPRPMFPNAFPIDNKRIPSWLRVEIKKNRLGWGRINDV